MELFCGYVRPLSSQGSHTDAQGNWTNVCNNRMGYLRLLCRHEHCHHLPYRLLPIPRDQAAIPRRREFRLSNALAMLTCQVDLIFAVANAEKRSPVKVSAMGDTPKAGSVEAERVLGRATDLTPVNNEGKKRFDAHGEARHEEV